MGTDTDDPRIGQLVDGRYELVEILGSGGMGIVYKAWHTLLKTTVALKLVKPDAGQVASIADQMLVEAQAAARIKHPNVVSVLDAGRTREGEIFIVMEHIEGSTLEALLGAKELLPVERARSLLVQVATGLAAAHAQGVIHRDVKPANCMVTRLTGGTEILKILDFGIAKILEDANETAKVNPSTRPVHTRHYAAPEVRHGSASSVRSDVYSLGVLAYRLLTRKYPFAETFLELTPPEQHRPDLPRDLRSLLCDMLERDPDRRPQSMADVCLRLRDGAAADLLVPESSLGASTVPEATALDTAPAVTSEQPVHRSRRPATLASWVSWGVVLGGLATIVVLMADASLLEGKPITSTPTIASAAAEPKPGPDRAPHADPHDDTARKGSTEGLPRPTERTEHRQPTEPTEPTERSELSGHGGPPEHRQPTEPTEPRAIAPDAPPRRAKPPDPMRRAKAKARRCLIDGCSSGAESSRARVTVSFQVRAGKVLLPKIAASSTATKTCIFDALSSCTLTDGSYEDLTIDL